MDTMRLHPLEDKYPTCDPKYAVGHIFYTLHNNFMGYEVVGVWWNEVWGEWCYNYRDCSWPAIGEERLSGLPDKQGYFESDGFDFYEEQYERDISPLGYYIRGVAL